MLTLPLGFIAIILVTIFSLDLKDAAIYVNTHSFVIVVLGTIAVVLCSTPKKDLRLTFKAFKDLFKKDLDEKEIKKILIKLSQNKNSPEKYENIALINEAINLWERGVDQDTFRSTMYEKYSELNQLSEIPVAVLRNLSKYPPALGMTGTVMGMISLFAHLTADNKSTVGQSLALAMTATFYGLLLANMFLLPLADRLQAKHLLNASRNDLILTALLKINFNEPTSMVESMNLEQRYYEQAG
ncbi:MAG: MotA/TolQ/ExbB proton channel family protein [Halobacteriovoraceae bacterium]|nr:MotA/TolQ/ExbB proton channel family protein [Halobacteriovoraceae bacterium]MCB9094215.1 MotA/TolQ/ExbB proton channel family protein [Halobacteriovoraceae bacterium]